MTARNSICTLRLDEIDRSARDPHRLNVRYCHTFGIFLSEVGQLYWRLADETCPYGIRIKLIGDKALYPKPKHGDVVRIHRLTFDQYEATRLPICPNPRNVVVWTSFQDEPTVVTVAKKPTIEEEDRQRRRCLEAYYCSTITKIMDIPHPDQVHDTESLKLIDVAGRLVHKEKDLFGHYVLRIADGTGELRIRVFQKKIEKDCSEHFETADQLKVGKDDGDLILVTGVKQDVKHKNLLQVNLSANLLEGRAIRLIENTSILGVVLGQFLQPLEPSQAPPPPQQAEHSQALPSTWPSSQESGTGIMPRRSPRLNQNQQVMQQTNGTSSRPNQNGVSHSSPPLNPPTTLSSPNQQSFLETTSPQPHATEVLPKCSNIGDINVLRGYSFYDIAGQVRGKPHQIDDTYRNWIFQLFDGTKPSNRNFHSFLLEHVEPNCIPIVVYAKVKPQDTDEHIKMVQTLEPMDLVHVRNVKVSRRDGSLKFEMSANLDHGKSIEKVNKSSAFGVSIQAKVFDGLNDSMELDDGTNISTNSAAFRTPPEPDDESIAQP